MKDTVLIGILGCFLAAFVEPVTSAPVQLPIDQKNYLILPPGTKSYQNYVPYVVYDMPQVNTAVRNIPMAVFSNGRPSIANVPITYNYYGTPIYDFRIGLQPINPQLLPGVPGNYPRPQFPQTPVKPPVEKDIYDGIETLDVKMDPSMSDSVKSDEENKVAPGSEDVDDTVTVYATGVRK